MYHPALLSCYLCAFSSYWTSRLWPRLWSGEHMQEWILRLLLHWQVCAEWARDNTTVGLPGVISLLSLPHSGLGCHYLHLDKGRCSSDPMLEGCRMYKPSANGVSEPQRRPSRPRRCQPLPAASASCCSLLFPEPQSECWKESGLHTRAENPRGEIYHMHSRCFLGNLTSQVLSKDKTSQSSAALTLVTLFSLTL